MNSPTQVDAIYLDLQKAFDTVQYHMRSWLGDYGHLTLYCMAIYGCGLNLICLANHLQLRSGSSSKLIHANWQTNFIYSPTLLLQWTLE